MPIQIVDVDGGRGNIIKGWGVLTGKEVVEAFTMHVGQDKVKFSRYRYSLSDYTEVTNLFISTQEIRQIAQLMREMTGINKDAVVALAANDDIIFRLSNVLKAITDAEEIWKHTTFTSLDVARGWIEEEVGLRHGIHDIEWKM
jgi:hypothetical protein